MQLRNINIIGRNGLHHIQTKGDRISIVTDEEKQLRTDDPWQLSFEGALAFPGLINSHDHLDFNLFSPTGNKTYSNYVEWGADIQVSNKQEIKNILKVPRSLRILWGLYKNLLAGVTTVVHHGEKIQSDTNLLNLFRRCHDIHSVQRDKHWKLRLNNIGKLALPVVVHTGEGKDDSAKNEIDRLLKWNLLHRNLVGIHGISMTATQASRFRGLVWCPASNYFLYRATAAIDVLKHYTTILLGSDSTLTGSWNFRDHLRVARQSGLVTDQELIDMVTSVPARCWNMKSTGNIAENNYADIVVARASASPHWPDAFFRTNPEDILLVLVKGNIRLIDETVTGKDYTTKAAFTNFSRIYVNGIPKLVQGDLPGLIKKIHNYNPAIPFPITFD